jgi:hypothetical protein
MLTVRGPRSAGYSRTRNWNDRPRAPTMLTVRPAPRRVDYASLSRSLDGPSLPELEPVAEPETRAPERVQHPFHPITDPV